MQEELPLDKGFLEFALAELQHPPPALPERRAQHVAIKCRVDPVDVRIGRECRITSYNVCYTKLLRDVPEIPVSVVDDLNRYQNVWVATTVGEGRYRVREERWDVS